MEFKTADSHSEHGEELYQRPFRYTSPLKTDYCETRWLKRKKANRTYSTRGANAFAFRCGNLCRRTRVASRLSSEDSSFFFFFVGKWLISALTHKNKFTRVFVQNESKHSNTYKYYNKITQINSTWPLGTQRGSENAECIYQLHLYYNLDLRFANGKMPNSNTGRRKSSNFDANPGQILPHLQFWRLIYFHILW